MIKQLTIIGGCLVTIGNSAVVSTTSSGDWSDTAIWNNATLPTIDDQAYISSVDHNVTISQTQSSGNILINGGVVVQNGGHYDGGAINIGQGGGGTPTLTVLTGGQVSLTQRLNVASEIESGNAVLNLYGGSINTTLDPTELNNGLNTFGVDGGSSTINLQAGSITTSGFLMNTAPLSNSTRTYDTATTINWESASSLGAGVSIYLTESGVNAYHASTTLNFTDFGFDTTFNFNGSNFNIGDEITLMSSASETEYMNYQNVNITGLDGQLSVSGTDLILTVVPEPTSAGLLGMGIMTVLMRRKRN